MTCSAWSSATGAIAPNSRGTDLEGPPVRKRHTVRPALTRSLDPVSVCPPTIRKNAEDDALAIAITRALAWTRDAPRAGDPGRGAPAYSADVPWESFGARARWRDDAHRGHSALSSLLPVHPRALAPRGWHRAIARSGQPDGQGTFDGPPIAATPLLPTTVVWRVRAPQVDEAVAETQVVLPHRQSPTGLQLAK
jgi:hypothetical protein